MYIDHYAKPRNKSWQETERLLAVDVTPRWGNRPIDTIGNQDVIALIDSVMDRAPVVANRVLSATKRVFSWLIERGMLETSPTDRIKKPAKEVARDRVVSDPELALIGAATDVLGYPAGPFVQLLILSVQRRCEVSDMTWGELDPDLTLWSLPRERVKNDEPHHLPVSSMMRDILRGLPRIAGKAGFVFTKDGTASLSDFSTIKRNLDAAITDLNDGVALPRWTFHDLRRAAATGMARLSIALPVVEKVLNHTSGSLGGVAGIYMRHDFRDEMRDGLERWGRRAVAGQAPDQVRTLAARRRRTISLLGNSGPA